MVLEVCANGVQLLCAPARSLWPSLASAVSTLALFGAADWGLADFLVEEGFIKRLLLHIVFVFAMPLFPLQFSLRNALTVWSMKQRIHKRQVSHMASISIFSICPLYIQVPSDYEVPESIRWPVGDVEHLKDLCPLELSPTGDPHATTMNTDQQQQDSIAQYDKQKKYIELISEAFMDLEPLREKEVLLSLGLVPEYSQLRFLRSRSRFQALVTALQAGGYVLSVVQRLAEHLAVCPLEALLCFLSVIIMLQLLLELYACSHYQRPLLLRLNHHQFSQFWNAPRDDTQSMSSRSLQRFGIIPYVTDSVLLVMLFSSLSIYYSVHYMHSCPVCSVAALLFLFGLLSWVIGFILFIKVDISRLIKPLWLLLFSAVILLSSMVLAVVSTARHWDLFHSPTNNSFSWILPHVSS